MKFNQKYVERTFWQLFFNEDIPTTEFKFDLPLLIDEKNKVISGNSLRNNYDMLDKVKCIVIKENSFLSNALADIEKEVILENSQDRFYEIQAELKKYLKSFSNNDYTKISLFDESLVIDKGFITEENYEKPVQYDYIQKNIVNREEVDEEEGYAGIFSDLGKH